MRVPRFAEPPWVEATWAGWTSQCALGQSEAVLTLDAYSTGLDVWIAPNGNVWPLAQPQAYRLDVRASVQNIRALVLSQTIHFSSLVSQASVPLLFQVRAAARSWSISIAIISTTSAPVFPRPGILPPMIQAQAHGREGGAA